MSKIAIISQPDEGVLIDVSGCSNLKEALEHLSSTLQVSSQFWQGLNVSINLGKLKMDTGEAAQIMAIAKGVGITPSAVYTKNSDTKIAFIENGANIGEGKPMSLPKIEIDPDSIDLAEVEETGKKSRSRSTVAKLKLRVADALKGKKAKSEEYGETENKSFETLEKAPEFSEKEENIRETINNRVISLQKESEQVAEVGAETRDGASLSVALTEAEEQIAETETEACDMKDFVEATDEITQDEENALELTSEIEIDIEASEEEEEEEEEEAEEEKEEVFMVEEEEAIEEEEVEEEVEVEEEPLTSTENVVVRPNPGGTMYLRQTLRSGQTVSHKGHLIIIGDVNPGAEVMA
ncbi:MAG TPA: septum site-determining protein MinC, partial [Candidatus Melainabacteria bacterium]|nr:septum site-determining protein MinC [Candidatus Melainabacteria bacterium]